LAAAGTEVCEPFELLELDVPEDTVGAVCGALAKARGTVRDTFPDGAYHRIICEMPTVELSAIEQLLPRLTRGEGNWTSRFEKYVPVTGELPTRPRSGPNPLNRAHYLAELTRS
jgi:ribosomal protection tetracycline resistance protein